MSKPIFEVANESFETFDQAFLYAGRLCLGRSESVDLDVVICDEEAAFVYGGDDAVEKYKEDPERSVFDRIKLAIEYEGGIA